MSLRLATVAGLAAGALLTAAAPAFALDEVTFGTNWVAEPEHGGFYQAVVDGTYEKYGLKVTIVPKADQAMLLGGKIQFYMQGNLLGTFSAAEQDVPVVEVAAIFQKDPQIIMAHPESGLKEFGDLGKLKSLFVGDDLYVTGYRWMMSAYPSIKGEQRKPYNYSVAPFLADKDSGQQGYVTSEPYSVKKEGGFEPTVFLMADAGYSTTSTMIEGMQDYVKANPDVTKRFVEASIIGWYNYMYGDNKAANDFIKKENPDMTDELIAFSIKQMKDYGLLVSGDSEKGGIGCFTDARVKDFYDKMVKAGVVKADLDLSKVYTTEYVCKGLGTDLVK
ncbi:MAG: ABC transporter substrate-binding protein [Rhizobiales bacterium]|nr:ABC transporter substrate-binding protein [Hyphomicrobiales bacterium]